MTLALVIWVGLLTVALAFIFIPWHRHRWTSWSDRVVTRDGGALQTRRCKDSSCNLQQIKDITP